MNITLTQKDADFILNYLRSNLQKTNEHFDFASEKEKELNDRFNADEELKNDPFAQLLVGSVRKMQTEYDALYKQKTDILVKCIELLTVGSEFGEQKEPEEITKDEIVQRITGFYFDDILKKIGNVKDGGRNAGLKEELLISTVFSLVGCFVNDEMKRKDVSNNVISYFIEEVMKA